MPRKQYPPGMWWPPPTLHSPVWNQGSYRLDATGKRVGTVFEIPRAGQLERVEWAPDSSLAIAAGSAIRASFQNVDASGLPDGTQDQFRDIAGSALSPLVWTDPGIMSSDGTDTGTNRVVAVGDIVAFVLEYQTFTAADDFASTQHWFVPSATQVDSIFNARPYPVRHDGASWAKDTTITPLNIAIKYTDGTYISVGPGVGPISAVSQIVDVTKTSSPSEVGMKFTVPFPTEINGVWAQIQNISDSPAPVLQAGADFTLNIYKADTSTPFHSVVVRKQYLGTSPLGNALFAFEPVVLSKGVEYRVTLAPFEEGTGGFGGLRLQRYGLSTPSHQMAFPGGSALASTERTGSANFVDNDLIRPLMGIRFSAMDIVLPGAPAPGSGGRGFTRGWVGM